jgi:hypothetical protein
MRPMDFILLWRKKNLITRKILIFMWHAGDPNLIIGLMVAHIVAPMCNVIDCIIRAFKITATHYFKFHSNL